ncbi:MAG: hypothetical protein AAF968_11380 [Pseudomonadota bacterium]
MAFFKVGKRSWIFVAALCGAATFGALPAAALDCKFFEEQALEHDSSGHPAMMLEACQALSAYRDRLLEENVRYAFGPRAAANPESVARRSEPLDTFHVLPEYRLYHLALETGVLKVLNTGGERPVGEQRSSKAHQQPMLRLRPAEPLSREP